MKIDTFHDLKLEVFKSEEDGKYIARIVNKVLGMSYRQGSGYTKEEALEELHKNLKYHLFVAERYIRFFEDEVQVMQLMEALNDQKTV